MQRQNLKQRAVRFLVAGHKELIQAARIRHRIVSPEDEHEYEQDERQLLSLSSSDKLRFCVLLLFNMNVSCDSIYTSLQTPLLQRQIGSDMSFW